VKERHLHVALVDDDRVYQFTIEKMLKRLDQRVRFQWFKDGEEAIVFINKHAFDPDQLPDILILDINMPYMDGWQFLDVYEIALPALAKRIDIFMISSSADVRDQNRARQCTNVTEYLEKPITTDLLRQLLARYSLSDARLH